MPEPVSFPNESSPPISLPADESHLVFRLRDPGERLDSLDFLRGGAIFFMVLLNALYYYESVPSWLKHAPDDGLTLPDLGVPIFLFALGLSYQISWRRWLERTGKKKAVHHFLLRFFLLWAFGFWGELMVFGHFTWGVLATIGTLGLFCLPFFFFPPLPRLLISFFLLIGYQASLALGLPVYFIEDGLGGPVAVIAWNFPVLVAASLGKWINERSFSKKMSQALAAGLLLTLAGLLASYIIPFNKHKVSLSYVLFTTGVSLVIFLVSFIVCDIWKFKVPVFTVLGKNPLVVYMASGILTLGLNAVTPLDASLGLLFAESLLILAINYGLAVWLDKHGIALRV